MSVTERLAARRFVTDGGLETELIYRHGVELPEFAAYPLLADDAGRTLLRDYYDGYARIAVAGGHGLALESPTWRANADWGALLGHDANDLAVANEQAIDLLCELAAGYGVAGVPDIVVAGTIGPRGDGYAVTTGMSADEAADYHLPQLAAFAAAGAELATAYTLGYPDEARGIVRAARHCAIPVAVSFTVETDGRLPDGTTLADAVAQVDATDPPDHFGVNCAHPDHVVPALADDGPWRERIVSMRGNASRQSHAELDAADELDAGDPADFAASHAPLTAALPGLRVLGGCCGTDARHVAALWQLVG